MSTRAKYAALKICPIVSKGSSTGLAPIHVRRVRVAKRVQNIVFFVGLNLDLAFLLIVTVRTRMDAKRAMTPPSFEGIDRRMAYANKKYHSG